MVALSDDALWDQHARDWTCLQEARHRPLRRALLGAVGPLAELRLLDVGCGVGLLLREADERGARVSGVDVAEELLEVARWALPDADLRVGAPGSLPYGADTFDVATACNALRYAGDQRAALAELVRVVRPGGRLAIGDWADPAGSLSGEFAARLGVHDLTTRLADHLRAAGLDLLDGSELQFPVTYPDLPTAWSAMLARECVAAAVRRAGRATVYRTFTEVFAAAARPNGTVRDDNAFRYLIARKPVRTPPARSAAPRPRSGHPGS